MKKILKRVTVNDTLEKTDIRKREQPKTFDDREILHSTLKDVSFNRNGPISYLATCYNNHLGARISPDMIWNIFAAHVTAEIADTPDVYRKLFTRSEEKIEILIPGTSYLIEPEAFIEKLKDLVPTDVDKYIPNFTTTKKEEKFTHNLMFMDAVSHYYSYGIYLCGIPFIEILGTKEDWNKLTSNIDKIASDIPRLRIYAKDFIHTVDKMLSCDDIQWWKDIYSLIPCGSGSQAYVNGWFSKFYHNNKQSGMLIEDFRNCVAKVEYFYVVDGKKYKYNAYAGLLGFKENGLMLEPVYGHYITHREKYDYSKQKTVLILRKGNERQGMITKDDDGNDVFIKFKDKNPDAITAMIHANLKGIENKK